MTDPYQAIYNQAVSSGDPLPFTLPDWVALAPFERYLGMEIDHAADGTARLSMPFMGAHYQGTGLMHGGAVVSLADTALAMAIKTVLPPNTPFVTKDLALRFFAAVTGGVVTATAKVTRFEGRDIDGVVTVVDQESKPVAEFTAAFKVLRPR
jgi:uncharacterized protein (TIGR00369 family)